MLKLLLLCAALAVAVTGRNNKTCSMVGKTLTAFSGTKEVFKFNCKLHAIRNTVCGIYRLTVTPGMLMISKRNKTYDHIIEKVWIGVKRMDNQFALEGRMSRKTAGLYLKGKRAIPYNKKEGILEPTHVFNFSRSSTTEVTLKEKTGDFTIKFQLFDLKNPKSSKFSFECHSLTFQPPPFPVQMCGNGTKNEAATMKNTLKMTGSRQPVIALAVFNFSGLAQTDSDCKSASNYMQRCKIDRGDVIKDCYKLMYKRSFEKCLIKGFVHPQRATHFCVEFACSNFTDPNSCFELNEILDDCPKLPLLTNKVKDRCSTLKVPDY